jgi:hypothetical protein
VTTIILFVIVRKLTASSKIVNIGHPVTPDHLSRA